MRCLGAVPLISHVISAVLSFTNLPDYMVYSILYHFENFFERIEILLLSCFSSLVVGFDDLVVFFLVYELKTVLVHTTFEIQIWLPLGMMIGKVTAS